MRINSRKPSLQVTQPMFPATGSKMIAAKSFLNCFTASSNAARGRSLERRFFVLPYGAEKHGFRCAVDVCVKRKKEEEQMRSQSLVIVIRPMGDQSSPNPPLRSANVTPNSANSSGSFLSNLAVASCIAFIAFLLGFGFGRSPDPTRPSNQSPPNPPIAPSLIAGPFVPKPVDAKGINP